MHLAEHEIHIYAAPLTASQDERQAYLQLLSDDEQARAQRFISEVHQQRFIIAHGILRQLLAAYTELDPAAIQLSYGQHHKPSLKPSHQQPLQFNLSHSADMAVYAFAHNDEIGVDIEKIRPGQNIDVAERFFSPTEIKALQALTDQAQTKAFFKLWSRKEAIVKANGRGLSQPLSSFSVAADDSNELVALLDQTWALYSLPLHPEFAAALATAQPATRILIWDYLNQQALLRSTIIPSF